MSHRIDRCAVTWCRKEVHLDWSAEVCAHSIVTCEGCDEADACEACRDARDAG